MRLLRARPLFRRLWAAGAISLVGDWLGFVGVGAVVLQRHGGPMSLVGLLAAQILPQALASPVAGALVDRFDRRTLLVLANALQAAVTAVLAMSVSTGSVPLLQALVLARAIVGTLVVPAETAALRRTVEPDELMSANAFLSFTWSVAYVAGMALGGFAAMVGPVFAIGLDAASFLLAASIVTTLPRMPSEAARVSVPAAFARVPGDLRAAARLAAGSPELLYAVLGKAPVAVAGGAGWLALMLVADRAPFGSVALSVGLLQAVRGAGTGLGPAATTMLVARGASARGLGRLAVIVMFAGTALFPWMPGAALLLATALAWGAGSGANWVLTSTTLQRHAPDAFVGRLAALDEWSTHLALVGGALLTAALVQTAGVALGSATCAGVLAGVLAWTLLGSAIRRSHAAVVVESRAA
jgi:MFS family permease